MIETKVVLPSCYLPSLAYMAFVLNSKQPVIEIHEHFVKSTERNRAEVAGTNGVFKLSVPIEGGKSHRQVMKDTRISNEFRWQKIHWQTLTSCYRRSAYFEYFEDKLAPFYTKQYDFLLDFNMELFHCITDMLKADVTPEKTTAFEKEFPSAVDLRGKFKNSSDTSFDGFVFTPPRYFQCFEQQTGFLHNLSVLDILFSEGPHAKGIIMRSLTAA